MNINELTDDKILIKIIEITGFNEKFLDAIWLATNNKETFLKVLEICATEPMYKMKEK